MNLLQHSVRASRRHRRGSDVDANKDRARDAQVMATARHASCHLLTVALNDLGEVGPRLLGNCDRIALRKEIGCKWKNNAGETKRKWRET